MKPIQKSNILLSDLIIYEDTHILVCHKPAKMAVETKQLVQKDLESILKTYLSSSSPEPVYLATINRLDQPVEGLILFAKTKKAAAELNRQLTQNRITKEYLALLSAVPLQKKGTLRDYMIKDGKNNISRVVPKDEGNAKLAELSYELLETLKDTALVRIQLKTGRHHQIRAQFSHLGCPLLGDVKYGGIQNPDLCLCAFHLGFLHPITLKPMDFMVAPKNVSFFAFSKQMETL